jgi:hypothetical protein
MTPEAQRGVQKGGRDMISNHAKFSSFRSSEKKHSVATLRFCTSKLSKYQKFQNLPKLSKFLAICFWDSLCDGFTQSMMHHPRDQGYLSSLASLGLSLASFSCF